ncbi:metallophosphoesterase [Bacillus sp. FJAT-45037]|uniref:metallophosphoesterase n=1 Tax=Bacillus sp. FJAT-45037 TaxID=2011007 RepID=UPI000C23CCAC|nr:metallophosphoesterase [Bacillus sp. FJAT-45037]
MIVNIAILFSVLAIILLVYMGIEAFRNRLTIHHLKGQSLPRTSRAFRVFFISDIHKRKVSKRLLDQLDQGCDLVIIGGDLVEKKVPQSQFDHNLLVLSQLGPTYFVWGNNDPEVNVSTLRESFKRHGVTELSQTSMEIEFGGSSIRLIGLDEDWSEGVNERSASAKASFTIVVSHYPDVIREASRELKPNLALSGHTHGGQIRFFRFGIAERGGVKDEGEFLHIISNGYGTTSLPLRLGAAAEAHLILLNREPNSN